MDSIRSAQAATTAFIVSMRGPIATCGRAAAIAFPRRMGSRLFLGAVPTAAVAGLHAFVEDDLLRHVVTPLVTANRPAT